MGKWTVYLIPNRNNGRNRWWVGQAPDWDTALELAEEANPGWIATQAGPYVPGNAAGV